MVTSAEVGGQGREETCGLFLDYPHLYNHEGSLLASRPVLKTKDPKQMVSSLLLLIGFFHLKNQDDV